MKKRILSILLAAIMVLAIVPFSAITAFADTPEAEITEVSTFGELLNAVNSDKTHIKLTKDIVDIVPDDELPTKHRLVFDGGNGGANQHGNRYGLHAARRTDGGAADEHQKNGDQSPGVGEIFLRYGGKARRSGCNGLEKRDLNFVKQ